MMRLPRPFYGVGDPFAMEADDQFRKKRDAEVIYFRTTSYSGAVIMLLDYIEASHNEVVELSGKLGYKALLNYGSYILAVQIDICKNILLDSALLGTPLEMDYIEVK